VGDKTGIEWTDKTWSPWTGCQAVSAACDFCYAEALDGRFGKAGRWGPHGERVRTAQSYWDQAFTWDRSAALNGIRYRVFPSMCDPFDNHRSIAAEWRREFWFVVRATPHLTWQILTKRPQNIVGMLPDDWGEGYPNVWLGVTVENQAETRRITALEAVPCKLRFLSCEPLLQPIVPDLRKVDWVIAGGESGKQARPSNVEWFRVLRDDCAADSVPFFMKQMWGTRRADLDAIPADLLVRQFPNA
jgi:protein gp37